MENWLTMAEIKVEKISEGVLASVSALVTG